MAAKNSSCNCPTLIYPNGGENISTRSINITWYVPEPHNTAGAAVWYEIFFTDAYSVEKKNEWKQIAFLPASDKGSFTWNIPFGVCSSTCRLSIRCRDAAGNVSNLSESSDNFSIGPCKLVSPVVVSPVPGGLYRFAVLIAFDNKAVEGFSSQRGYYQAYYNSKTKNRNWLPINETIPIGPDPFIWDVRDLDPSNDYNFKFQLVNQDNRSSEPVFIEGVSILPVNNVILDSTPPKGTISIQNESEFTKNRDVTVKFTAYDAETGVKSVIVRQETEGSDEINSLEQAFAGVQSWHITGDDGVKLLGAQFKDFAGNMIRDSISKVKFFRPFLSDQNAEVSAFILDGTNVWTAFKSMGFPLYKNLDFIVDLNEEVTALVIYDNVLYISTKNDNNEGIIYKFLDNALSQVHEFGGLDSAVNAMAVFKDDLYFGLQNGELHKFNKTIFSLVKTYNQQVKGLFGHILSLYILLENSDEIITFNGSSFITAGLLDGSQ